MLAEEDATTPATKTIDVDIAKPISRITVRMRATNNGSDPTAHPTKMLPKIELVDGSNVLFSLSGIEAQALNCYEHGYKPDQLLVYANDVMCDIAVQLNFGRFLWDEQLAFDGKKFSNPQLRITHDLSKGGSSPDAATLSVLAHAFDELLPVPVGFLMSKEQFGYTLNGTAKESIDLATDMAYRFLIIQSLYAGRTPSQQFNKIKLSEDNDARVVINDESTSLLIYLLQKHQRFVEYILTYGLGSANLMYCTPTFLTDVKAFALDSADATMFSTQSYGGSITATTEAAQLVQWLVSGLCPHGALAIPFGDPALMEKWYDVSKIGALKLILTGGSGATGTCEIVSQQLRKY